MFRITLDESIEDKRVIEYLQEIASQTILKAFEFTFNKEADWDIFYEAYYTEFFEGIGTYFKGTDDEFGREWFKRKVESAKKKLMDQNQAYTFDIFEENIFCNVCEWIAFCRSIGKKNRSCTIHKNQEEQISQTLANEFLCDEYSAQYYARSVCRCWEMTLQEDEEENLFFWDDDYIFFFQEGFLKGLLHLKGFAGEMAGYGYDYVVRMFEEIGAQPPIMLLGSKEANRIANETALEEFRKKQDEFSKDYQGTETELEEKNDEDLPFN